MRHPQAIHLGGIKLRQNAGVAAWNFLDGFRFHRRRTPGPVGVLRDLQVLEDAIRDVRAAIVADMRSLGCTWEEVGEALDVSAETARRRYS